jgi:transposase
VEWSGIRIENWHRPLASYMRELLVQGLTLHLFRRAAPSHDWGELILDRWYGWAIRSRLEPMKKVARTIQQHRDRILRWFNSKIANGLIEGINSRPLRRKRVATAHCAISWRSST